MQIVLGLYLFLGSTGGDAGWLASGIVTANQVKTAFMGIGAAGVVVGLIRPSYQLLTSHGQWSESVKEIVAVVAAALVIGVGGPQVANMMSGAMLP